MTPLPPPDPTLVTTRDRVTRQTSAPQCAACHETLINPLGFGFEQYDAVGAWRDTENGAPIDASGRLAVTGGEIAFQNGLELSASIATSPDAQLCYARRWVEFIHRRESTAEDVCTAEQLGDRLADPTYGVTDLLVDLTRTPSFIRRAQ